MRAPRAEDAQRLRSVRGVGNGDDPPPADGAPGQGLQPQAGIGIEAVEQARIRRVEVEVDAAETGLFGEGVGQVLGAEMPLDEQDMAEQRILPALGDERRLDLVTGHPSGADEYVAEERTGRGRLGPPSPGARRPQST